MQRVEMQDIFNINKIVTEFEETREDFIYKTIFPYCEEITEQKLSKERLRKLLLLGLDAERELESEVDKMELKDTVDGMLSKDYKERFIAEYKQLIIRLNKLESTIAKAKNNSLDFKLNCPRIVLETQAIYMRNYADILRMRARQEGIDLE